MVQVTITPDAALADGTRIRRLSRHDAVRRRRALSRAVRRLQGRLPGDAAAQRVQQRSDVAVAHEAGGTDFINQPNGATYTLAGRRRTRASWCTSTTTCSASSSRSSMPRRAAGSPGILELRRGRLHRSQQHSHAVLLPSRGTAPACTTTVRARRTIARWCRTASTRSTSGPSRRSAIAANPAHWQVWTSPVVTIARP